MERFEGGEGRVVSPDRCLQPNIRDSGGGNIECQIFILIP